jgi:hypothetical protein
MPAMELAFSLVAIVVAVVALVLVLRLRNLVAQLPRMDTFADPRADLDRLRQELSDVRRDLDRALGQVEELKAATQVLPAPPLPRARSSGLTDLREQLRAAHREADPTTEE